MGAFEKIYILITPTFFMSIIYIILLPSESAISGYGYNPILGQSHTVKALYKL
jgi:hypothetical protein